MVARTGKRLGKGPQYQSVVLFDQYSESDRSQVFEVRETPIVISAFGLQPGETIVIYTALQSPLGDIEQPFVMEGSGIVLSAVANAARLSVSGRYRAVFFGVLHLDMVCVYKHQIAGTNNDIMQPSGVQANRPNLFFQNGGVSNTSHVIEIRDTAWLFTAYGLLLGETITVLSSYGLGTQEELEPFLLDGLPKLITPGSNSLVLNKSGRYRFQLVGDPTHVLLVGNQTIQGAEADTGSGNPHTVAGGVGIDVDNTDPFVSVVSLNSASQDAIALATTALQPGQALQPGDNISELVNDVGYVTSSIITENILAGDTTHAPSGNAVFSALAVKVNNSRAVNTGAGLTGGGNLTADRTIALNAASIASLVLADSAIQPGDNISELVNNVGYLTSALQPGDNVSELVNDVGYVTSAILAPTVVDGDITHAPTGNAVFDAIALKENKFDFSGTVFISDSLGLYLGAVWDKTEVLLQTTALAKAIMFGQPLGAIASNTAPAITGTGLADAIATGNWAAAIADAAASGSADCIAGVAALSVVNWANVKRLVFWMGTNDPAYGFPGLVVPLGAITDTTGATFRGAVNHITNVIGTAHPHIRIAFVSPGFRQNADTTTNALGLKQVDYVDALIERAQANKTPTLDLFRLAGINQYNWTEYLFDGLHNNTEGAELLADEIAGWMRGQTSSTAHSILTTSITNGDVTHAPDGNAVFDALALKANDANVVHKTGDETIADVKTFTKIIDTAFIRAGTVAAVPTTGQGVEMFVFLGLGNIRHYNEAAATFHPMYYSASDHNFRLPTGFDPLVVDTAGVTVDCSSSTAMQLTVLQPGTSPADSSVAISSPGGFPGIIGTYSTTKRRDIQFRSADILIGASSDTSAPTRYWTLDEDGVLRRSFSAVGTDRSFMAVTNTSTATSSSATLGIVAGTSGTHQLSGFAPEYTIVAALTGRILLEGANSGVAISANNAAGNITFLTGTGRTLRATLTNAGAFNIATAAEGLQVAGTKVIGARSTGWAAATGTATRTTFATSTVTLPQLAERVKALLDNLITHGLIGA